MRQRSGFIPLHHIVFDSDYDLLSTSQTLEADRLETLVADAAVAAEVAGGSVAPVAFQAGPFPCEGLHESGTLLRNVFLQTEEAFRSPALYTVDVRPAEVPS